MSGHRYAAVIPKWISAERFESYLRHAGGDPGTACVWYEWAAELTSASFELVQYVEVMLRNAIDEQLRLHCDENRSCIPWFLTPLSADKKSQEEIDRTVEAVRIRLRKKHARMDTRDQIVAGLSFGFWAELLNSRQENLWRSATHKAFPHSSGRRSDVAAKVFALRVFRNRLAHHDSLLALDVRFHVDQMIEVAGWIDPDAAAWLRSVERVSAVHARRPAARMDTVVVAGDRAWPLYQKVHAYVCQAGRVFEPVEHLAFYAGRAIQPEIAVIRERLDNVDWGVVESRRLRAAGDARSEWIADVIDRSRADGWTEGRYQLFLLSAPGERGHHTRSAAIPHPRAAGRAFTLGQRYAVKQQLVAAAGTEDLC